VLDELYEIQKILTNEMPQDGTQIRKALDLLDRVIDQLELDKVIDDILET
jgi:hypothetical protein